MNEHELYSYSACVLTLNETNSNNENEAPNEQEILKGLQEKIESMASVICYVLINKNVLIYKNICSYYKNML